jgi:folate-binding protein YgfZ
MDSARPAPATEPPGYAAAREGLAHRIRPAGIIDVIGEDRVAYLQGQLTQEMRNLAPGETREAAGLTPKGKLLFVARVLGLPDRIRLLLPESLRTPALEHLRRYAVFTKVAIEDRSDDFLRVGLYGAGATAWAAAPEDVLRLPGHGEFSAELVVPVARRAAVEGLLEAAGSQPVPDETAEILRVEAARPRFGSDMDGTNLPDEVGLAAAISTTKGCYVGQEVVARLRTYGRVNRRLVRFRFGHRAIEPGTALRRPEDEVPARIEAGRVTSSALSPALGPIGLGFAFRDVAGGDRLLSAADARDVAVVSDLDPA